MYRWLIVALAACGDNIVATAQVHDGFLHDAEGRALIMRGVNLSGSQKTAPYLDDKTPADYARLRTDWGFNTIRFVMTWAAVEPHQGVYDDAYLDHVAERLGWAHDAGLAVVLDMHEDIYGEGFGFDGAPVWTCDEARYAAFVPTDPWFLNATEPNVVACVDGFYARPDLRAAFTNAWRHVAERLHDQPAVIGFDVLNEPAWGSYPIRDFEADLLGPMYAEIVPAVRGAAPRWVAFLEPSASRNIGIATRLSTAPFPDVVYSPHSYDSMAESGNGFDPSRSQLIIDNVADLRYEATQLDAGLWIGEYGGNADAPHITEYMTAQYDAAGVVSASTMYWAYDKSGGYGLLDADGNEKPTLLAALVRPYPEAVAGTPTSYAFAAGTFTMIHARSIDHRTDGDLGSRACLSERLHRRLRLHLRAVGRTGDGHVGADNHASDDHDPPVNDPARGRTLPPCYFIVEFRTAARERLSPSARERARAVKARLCSLHAGFGCRRERRGVLVLRVHRNTTDDTEAGGGCVPGRDHDTTAHVCEAVLRRRAVDARWNLRGDRAG